jgi:hypothetical protein
MNSDIKAILYSTGLRNIKLLKSIFHLPITLVEVLCSQRVLQVDKQVIVAQSEIRAVRRLVK